MFCFWVCIWIVWLCVCVLYSSSWMVGLCYMNLITGHFFLLLLYSSFDQRPFQRLLTSRVRLPPFVEQYGVFSISFTLFFSSHLLFFSHLSFLHSSSSGSVPAAHKSSICSVVAVTFRTCFHKLMLWKMNPNLWNSIWWVPIWMRMYKTGLLSIFCCIHPSALMVL